MFPFLPVVVALLVIAMLVAAVMAWRDDDRSTAHKPARWWRRDRR